MRETTCGTSRKDTDTTWYGDHDGENKFLHTVTIPHVQELKDANLCHSLSHQQKFFTTKETVISWVKTHEEQKHLLHVTGILHFALILNENYAFRHIFKNGGTTIAAQTGQTAQTGPEIKHVRQSDIGNRRLLAMVRDPIDHFLSGWAECGKKHFSPMKNLIDLNASYDDRVRAWLDCVRYGSNKCALKPRLLSCRAHSNPQATFLFLNETTFEWDPRYDIIGDLSEMPGLLNMISFPYNASITKRNEANVSEITTQYFPRDKSLLSERTIQDICRYVALDYYLFDFNPPEPCQEELMKNIADMRKSPHTERKKEEGLG